MSCRLYEGRRLPSTPNLYRYWGGTHHLPQGVFDDESRDTDYEYLYLGKAAEGFYMRRDDFENRLTDTVLQSDFDKMEAGRTDFFHVWNSRGTQLAAPRTFMVDALGMDLGKWSYLQKRNWEKVKESVAKATLPKPYAPVMGRFIQLPKNIPLSNFTFSTVEGEPHVTLQELKSYVAKLTGPRPHVMSWDEASNDGSLYRIGSSFLGFYDTWVDSSTYMRLCSHFDAIPQERRWPDQAKAMEINDVPVVIDFVVERDAMVWPMVPAGVSNDAIQIARGLSPKWDREDDPATEQGLDSDGSGIHHEMEQSALYPDGQPSEEQS